MKKAENDTQLQPLIDQFLTCAYKAHFGKPNGSGCYLNFQSKIDAQSFLSILNTLLGDSIDEQAAFQFNLAVEYAPHQFFLSLDQWRYIREKIRKNAHFLKPKADIYIKNIRYDEYGYFDRFSNEVINPENKENKYPKRTAVAKNYTVDGDAIYKRRADLPGKFFVKKPCYTAEEKKGFTNFQSTSLVMEDFFPAVFGFGKRDVLAGVRFGQANVLITKSYIYDGGTVDMPYDFWFADNAKAYAEKRQGKILFSRHQTPAFKRALKEPENIYKYNEVLARLRFIADDSLPMHKRDMIFIGADNLESRLLAKQYAESMYKILRRSGKCSAGYKIPICFYIPQNKNLLFKEYTDLEYQLDCFEAMLVYSTQKNAKFLANHYLFLTALPPEIIAMELGELVSDLPLFLDLIVKGYVFVAKFLCERIEVDFKTYLLKILSERDLKPTTIAAILYQLICSEDKKSSMAMLDFLQPEVIKKMNVAQSPLVMAAQKGFAECVKRMIACGLSQDDTVYVKTPLHCAARNGHLEVVQELLKDKDSQTINGSYRSNKTPLFLASKNGHTAVVRELLGDYRCNIVTWKTKHPLFHPVRRGHEEIVRMMLMDMRYDLNEKYIDKTPFELAVVNGHIKIADMIREDSRVDLMVIQKMKKAYLESRYPGIHRLLDNLLENNLIFNEYMSDAEEAFFQAINDEKLDDIEEILHKNKGSNSDWTSAGKGLEIAAARGCRKVVKFLLQGYQIKPERMITAIETAASNRDMNVLEELLSSSACDLTAYDPKRFQTAIGLFGASEQYTLIKPFMKKILNNRDDKLISSLPFWLYSTSLHKGNSLLQEALKKYLNKPILDNLSIVAKLLEHGALLKYTNYQGKHCLDILEKHRKNSMHHDRMICDILIRYAVVQSEFNMFKKLLEWGTTMPLYMLCSYKQSVLGHALSYYYKKSTDNAIEVLVYSDKNSVKLDESILQGMLDKHPELPQKILRQCRELCNDSTTKAEGVAILQWIKSSKPDMNFHRLFNMHTGPEISFFQLEHKVMRQIIDEYLQEFSVERPQNLFEMVFS